MFRFLFRLFIFLLLVVAGAVAGAAYWVHRPLPFTAERVDFTIAPGSGMRAVARQLNEAGIPVQPDLFVLLTRASELDTQVKAGGYEVVAGDSLWQVLTRMASGDVTHTRITFIEGWTFRQFRAALQAHPDVTQTLADVDDATLMKRLGADADAPEGLFFPDTYSFAKGASDLDILRRAFVAQRHELAVAWSQREPGLPLKTPYEALILASIVEKETGHGPERTRIAGVFTNRLRIGMLLQTDPTVIYGLGEHYSGRLRRRDLDTDTPWNTYTRGGLPPRV
jgi:UPF0755 protein